VSRQPPNETPARAVSLHIERLVLDGVPLSRADATRLKGAVERELTRLLGEEGRRLDGTARAEHALGAPAVALTAPLRPLGLGERIARSIHAALERPS
jgi:hypothetical protein